MSAIEKAISQSVQVRVDSAMEKVHQVINSLEEIAESYVATAFETEKAKRHGLAVPILEQNVGTKWDEQEEDELIKELHQSIEIIARMHGRNHNGIYARVKMLFKQHRV